MKYYLRTRGTRLLDAWLHVASQDGTQFCNSITTTSSPVQPQGPCNRTYLWGCAILLQLQSPMSLVHPPQLEEWRVLCCYLYLLTHTEVHFDRTPLGGDEVTCSGFVAEPSEIV